MVSGRVRIVSHFTFVSPLSFLCVTRLFPGRCILSLGFRCLILIAGVQVFSPSVGRFKRLSISLLVVLTRISLHKVERPSTHCFTELLSYDSQRRICIMPID
ncbi:hypothetical protein BDV39DRAFT_110734 [Aspergillus sergii]|uniref:Uncharacterized protein n=1 Tax=Aspergillus sergii TaxID=1034303 RepID=A0A5N6X0P7_9EURO|nr:hypothetical protein BDV39DRAFT_110734 [Aspergillus sergii]